MLVLDGVEMLDVRETADLVGRTPETVRRWIWSGRLPAHRQGTKMLVSRRDVEALSGPTAVTTESSLAQWARDVRRQRASGVFGQASPGSSAADVVLENRANRQAG